MIRQFAVLACILTGPFEAHAESCSVAATPMSFAPYNAHASLPTDAVSVVTATCTGLLFISVTYEVRLDGGQEGSVFTRRMKQGASGQELGYQVYLNAGHTTVWGDGVSGSSYSGTMPLGVLTQTHLRTVYGRIAATQQVNAGAYADTPVMTIIY